MPPAEDSTQHIRAALLVAGGVMGAIGMMSNTSWLVYVAIAMLAVGVVLAARRRMQLRKRED